MNISHLKAFFLGSGFGLKVENYDQPKSNTRKAVTLALSWLFTTVTLGIFAIVGPLIGRKIHNKQSNQLNSTETKTQEASAPHLTKTNRIDFSKITPSNIDQILDVNVSNESFDFENTPIGMYSIVKKFHEDGLIEYAASLVFRSVFNRAECKNHCGFRVKDNLFEIWVSGTCDQYEQFSNLNEVLDYYCQGNFYLGESFKATEALILKSVEGKDIIYKNPYLNPTEIKMDRASAGLTKSADLSKITPLSIDQTLEVKGYSCRILNFSTTPAGTLTITKNISEENETIYNATLAYTATSAENSWVDYQSLGGIKIENNQFSVRARGISDYHNFKTLKGVLDYYSEGNFDQGLIFKETPTFILERKDRQPLFYKNLFYKTA